MAAALLATAPPAAAQSPLAAELREFSRRYHEDLPRLDALYRELSQVVTTDAHVQNWLALAQVCYIWGDVRARSPEDKLEAYDRGRAAAKRVTELEPRNPLGHFWLGVNAGRWGQTKGVLRSLFLLPTVKEAVETALALDPRLVGAYSLAGSLYYEVPGFLGGDLEKSEEMFRKGLALDARATGLRVGLARTLIKRKRIEEARRELTAVLQERQPSNPADWTIKDVKQARELLASLPDRS